MSTCFTGSVVISAITSCTNTSNPSVMLGAGLLAKRAVEKGLTVNPFIKTSLSPGSGVVTYYLKESGVIPYLEKLGSALYYYIVFVFTLSLLLLTTGNNMYLSVFVYVLSCLYTLITVISLKIRHSNFENK